MGEEFEISLKSSREGQGPGGGGCQERDRCVFWGRIWNGWALSMWASGPVAAQVSGVASWPESYRWTELLPRLLPAFQIPSFSGFQVLSRALLYFKQLLAEGWTCKNGHGMRVTSLVGSITGTLEAD